VQLERVGDQRPHVGAVSRRQALQERQQAQQLVIALVVVPALDRDAVGQLEAERLRGRPPRVALRAASLENPGRAAQARTRRPVLMQPPCCGLSAAQVTSGRAFAARAGGRACGELSTMAVQARSRPSTLRSFR